MFCSSCRAALTWGARVGEWERRERAAGQIWAGEGRVGEVTVTRVVRQERRRDGRRCGGPGESSWERIMLDMRVWVSLSSQGPTLERSKLREVSAAVQVERDRGEELMEVDELVE